MTFFEVKDITVKDIMYSLKIISRSTSIYHDHYNSQKGTQYVEIS